jgi:hypothetical protein
MKKKAYSAAAAAKATGWEVSAYEEDGIPIEAGSTAKLISREGRPAT